MSGKEKRVRLNFSQSVKGIFTFDGTVEIINPVDEMSPEDVAVVDKTAAEKLAEESLEILKAAQKKFKEDGHQIAGDSN
jgi:hypothetical protein